MNPSGPRIGLAFRPDLEPWLLPPSWRAHLEKCGPVSWLPPEAAMPQRESPSTFDVDILFGSWGMPRLDGTMLGRLPKLKAVFYAAGSVKGFVTPEFWRRGIVLSSAAAVNAKPTAAFAEAMIVLSLKQAWFYLRCERPGEWAQLSDTESSGVFGATIGILGLSRVGREVIAGLRRHEVRFLIYDPTVCPDEAADLNVQVVSLPELFSQSDVVSIHAPLIPATTGLVTGDLLQRMKPHATLVNTARGAIVRESELIEVMTARPDLTAVLDVTESEPAPADSPLRRLGNVVLTPHLAGARHREISLLARTAIEELERFLVGEKLLHSLDQATVERSA